MSKKYPAGIISKNAVVPSGNWATSSASGIWTLDQQAYWQNQGLWPDANNPQDTYFKNVTMLLHGDGANGAQNNTFLDSSVINSTVTRNGNTTQGTFSPYGSSWSNFFGGSGNSINYPSATQYAIGTGNFTIEFFVNFSVVNSGHNRFFCIGQSGTDGLEVDLTSGNLQVGIQNGYPISYAWTPVVGTWYHIAVVRSGTGSGQVALYINGTSVATGTSSNSIGQYSLSIGGISWQASWSVNGYISNVRLSNIARTITVPTAPYVTDVNTLFLGNQSNRFVDNSNYLASATLTGTPTIQRFSPFSPNTQTPISYSGYFDGTSDYLSIADNAAFDLSDGDFTLEAWVYHTTTTGAIQVYYSHQTNGLSFYRNASGNLEVSQDGVGILLTSSGTVSSFQWIHVAVSRASGSMKLFINGTQDGSSYNATILNSTNSVYIASDSSATYEFTGSISNLRLVKGSAVYTGSFTVPTTPLSAILGTSLLVCQAGAFIDSSANAFTVNVNGNSKTIVNNPFGVTASGPIAYSSPIFGGSTYFDGTGDYLTVPTNTSQQLAFYDFTIDFWFYSTANQGSGDVLANGYSSGSDLNWLIQADVSTMKFYASTTGNSWAVSGLSMGGIVNNQWNHFAVTRSANTVTTYLNGTIVSTATLSGTVYPNTSGIAIGTDNSSPATYPIQGYVSDFRMVIGTAVAPPAGGPTAPVLAVTNTRLLLSSTNAGIYDNAMMNDLETVGNAQISTGVKKYGTGSIYFDGTGDGLIANGVSSSGAYNRLTASGIVNTVEFWLYLNSFTSPRAFLCGSWASSVGWTYDVDTNGDIFITTNGSGPTVTLSSKITTGGWQHLAFVNDGTNIKIYLNGTNVGTQAVLAPTSYVGPFTIGMRSDSSLALNGYIDDLRITKGVARYTTTFTPPTQAFPNG